MSVSDLQEFGHAHIFCLLDNHPEQVNFKVLVFIRDSKKITKWLVHHAETFFAQFYRLAYRVTLFF